MSPQSPDPLIHVFTPYMTHAVGGLDSMVAVCPPTVSVPDRLNPDVDPMLVKLLTRLSQQGADRVNEVLHHADWLITSDPVVVQSHGMAHDCVRCRAGLDQALAHLKQYPQDKMLVGRLYWVGA